MARPLCITPVVVAIGLVVATPSVSPAAGTMDDLSVHVEWGFGCSDVRPLASPTSIAAMCSAGLGKPVRGRTHAVAEFSATIGDDIGGHIPEGPFAGRRSLTTLLVGLESSSALDARGLFAGAAVGIGHFTLSGATGGMREFLSSGWRYSSRNDIGRAVGGVVGYRTHGGPGPMGLQCAWRYHAVASTRRIAASATAITVGLEY